MTQKEDQPKQFWLELEVNLNVTYEIFPKRVEECHGLHTFSEDEEYCRQLQSVIIHLDNGNKIDLTDRLTEEEKELIANSEL
jgi:hypothetical protein